MGMVSVKGLGWAMEKMTGWGKVTAWVTARVTAWEMGTVTVWAKVMGWVTGSRMGSGSAKAMAIQPS
jgi:hypothetical protein